MIYTGENEILGMYIGQNELSVYVGETLLYPTNTYKNQYLTFDIISGGTICWKYNTYYSKTIYYSINGGEWSSWSTSESGFPKTVSAGDKVRFKGTQDTYANNQYYTTFSGSTAIFNIEGNIMSMLYGDNFSGQTELVSAYTFSHLFEGVNVISAENLILPATSLTTGCYRSMFQGCSSLSTAPALPATTLSGTCYSYMFQGCTSLTTAPELKTTTLAYSCYENMFYGCSSLATAPELKATTLTSNCYTAMFQGCTSLIAAPDLLATELASGCYSYMFTNCTNLNYVKCLAASPDIQYTMAWLDGVAATGTFVKNPDATWGTGVSQIPQGWTVEDDSYADKYLTFDIISGGTILCHSYNNSAGKTFQYSINNGEWSSVTNTREGFSITVSAGDKIRFKGQNQNYQENFLGSGSTAIYNVEGNIMSLIGGDNFSGLTELTATYAFTNTFRESPIVDASNLILPATSLSNHSYDSMFLGCTGLTQAPGLPATTLAGYCYLNMFRNCTSLTSAPAILPATSLAAYCYENMFYGCTSLTQAPALPATTLAEFCYSYMFWGCTSLTSAPAILPATSLAAYCYENMFYGCTSLTTAPELPATTLANSCYSYMFAVCSSLNYIKCLSTDISANNCTRGWLSNVASSGTFVKAASMTGWTTGVNGIPTNWTVQNDTVPYEQQYLTVEPLESGNLDVGLIWAYYVQMGLSNLGASYSLNDGSWVAIPDTGTTIQNVSVGDKIRFKAQNAYGIAAGMFRPLGDTPTGIRFNVYGNSMSLLYGDNFSGQTTFPTNYLIDTAGTFDSAFYCTNVVDASNLILPSTAMTKGCYRFMFLNCPEMTAAPELPAATLAEESYKSLFRLCTSLNYIKCLATDISATNCTGEWVDGVSSTGTFVKAASMTGWTTGVNGIPTNWTVQDAS